MKRKLKYDLRKRKIAPNIVTLSMVVILLSVSVMQIQATAYPGTKLAVDDIELNYVKQTASIAQFNSASSLGDWQLNTSLRWSQKQFAQVISPALHWKTNDGEDGVWWPLYEHLIQSAPNVTLSNEESTSSSITSTIKPKNVAVALTVLISITSNQVHLEVTVTSQEPTITSIDVILYMGVSISEFFHDHFITLESYPRQFEIYDAISEYRMKITPSLDPNTVEVAEWKDGPGDHEDVWSHILANTLINQTAESGELDVAMQFSNILGSTVDVGFSFTEGLFPTTSTTTTTSAETSESSETSSKSSTASKSTQAKRTSSNVSVFTLSTSLVIILVSRRQKRK